MYCSSLELKKNLFSFSIFKYSEENFVLIWLSDSYFIIHLKQI